MKIDQPHECPGRPSSGQDRKGHFPMSTTTSETKPATPAAKRASRARTKSADTKAKVDAMNDRSHELTRAQLIEKARRVGVLKPAGMSKPDLEKAIAAAEAKVDATILHGAPLTDVRTGEQVGTATTTKSTPMTPAKAAAATNRVGKQLAAKDAGKAAGTAAGKSKPGAGFVASMGRAMTPARRTTRGPRGVEARKVAAKLGKRGPGKKITDDDLVKYCAKVAKQHPETTASDELEQAYWVEKLAVNRDRFYRAWAEATKKAA